MAVGPVSRQSLLGSLQAQPRLRIGPIPCALLRTIVQASGEILTRPHGAKAASRAGCGNPNE